MALSNGQTTVPRRSAVLSDPHRGPHAVHLLISVSSCNMVSLLPPCTNKALEVPALKAAVNLGVYVQMASLFLLSPPKPPPFRSWGTFSHVLQGLILLQLSATIALANSLSCGSLKICINYYLFYIYIYLPLISKGVHVCEENMLII